MDYQLPRNMLADLPMMVSAKDIQQLLNCSRATAMRLIERLPKVDLSPPGAKKRLLRVHRAELYKFLNQNTIDG
ncbi:MAG: helix-turn-helix domain-containing protein [Clostridiales bacterium]|nr:helix-turn-helix domain-containing protein [Clostridiales bacterium]